jgi:hypothetical protein
VELPSGVRLALRGEAAADPRWVAALMKALEGGR